MYSVISFFGQDDTDILPFFLEHYRALGPAKFHIFIHGDWTQAELAPLRAADVTVAGVVQSSFGAVMKLSAIEAYTGTLDTEWLIVVDADEFLELPCISLAATIKVLRRIGLDELPAFLLQRAAPDGSLPALPDRGPVDAVFPCYDYGLAERMGVPYPIWKNKYPLVRLGPQLRLSRGHHLPTAGRPSAHFPIRAVLHHFKWRDRLVRSTSRIRGEGSNQREQDAYRAWLENHAFRLPTVGLKRCNRAALFAAGYLVRPTSSELSRLSALRKASSSPWAVDRKTTNVLRTLQSLVPAIEQRRKTASSYLDRRWLFTRPGRIALVSSDILGLRRTGGIGTAMSALAERLAGAGHEVQVFLSPYADFPNLSPAWFRYWEARGVRIRHFPRRNTDGRFATTQDVSLGLCRVLDEDDWDVIHFPDAGGMAAAPLLLRAAGTRISERTDRCDHARPDTLAS